MQITINGTPKEIAALVAALQEPQKEFDIHERISTGLPDDVLFTNRQEDGNIGCELSVYHN